MKKIAIQILFLTAFVNIASCQNVRDSIVKWNKILNFSPLKDIDKVSAKLPENMTTASGWHIDFFGRNSSCGLNGNEGFAFNQIDLETCIYNDSIEYDYWQKKHVNHNRIEYDSMIVFLETNSYLYIKQFNRLDTNKHILVIPKKQEESIYEFTELLYANYIDNIFIIYDPDQCQTSNKLYLSIYCLNTGAVKNVEFTKGKYFGNSYKECIEMVTYNNGKLFIKAVLTTKRKKPIREEKIIKL